MNKLQKRSLVFFLFFLLLTLMLFSSCEKKVEEVKEKAQKEVSKKAEEIKNKTKNLEEAQVVSATPELKGTWEGKFDKRSTKLVITEQTGNTFKGNITINYRNVIKQKVEGTINPKTKKITMKDLLHSRYKGKYEGQLSEDGKTFNGVFTMDVGHKKFNFSLTKK